MAMTEKDVERIVDEIAKRFRTFVGSGRPEDWNPIAAALEGAPLQFAAGVDVATVVSFVLASKTDAQTDTDERERKLSEQLHRTSNALMQWGRHTDLSRLSAQQSTMMVEEAQTIRTLLSQLDLLGKVRT
jgi:hypothetical protein